MNEESVKKPELFEYEKFFKEGHRESADGHYGKAAESFSKALIADPTDEQRKEALYRRAYARVAEGNSHLARQDLMELSEIEDSERVRKLLLLMGVTPSEDSTLHEDI